ncbi:CD40 ligand-like [Cheilinus undulatus]|uniref:CD40 ligand-like n=1 Tax=Cheilinus undulatus TaxID=241271 RepID=UPI001BD23ECF|nr:CD40 ligand-like [Cheilinus undulatus]
MELQSRCSHKYVLLQVWCGLLTVAMVVMAAVLISIKPKPAGWVPKTSANPSRAAMWAAQTKASGTYSWEIEHKCEFCSLDLHEDSINCSKTSLYFLYAQVTFSRHPRNNQAKEVILKRNPSPDKTDKKLVEGIFPHTTESSVWVAKIVRLEEGDSISVNITDDFLSENTFWGVFQLH